MANSQQPPHKLATWLRKLVCVLEVEELGPLGTAIKATKVRHVLGRPHSLLRGPIPGDTAAGKVPLRVWWLILDYDHGRRPIDRERLGPYLHFVWTTMSHEPGSPSERVAIPIVPATDAAGHDWLLNQFMRDYPKHHDDLMRAALLPVRRFDRSGRCSDVRILANLGELLRPPSPITLAATTPLPDPSPVPAGGYRLANALKANVETVCRFLGIRLPACSIRVGEDNKIQIHCPINPDHPDRHKSATVTIFARDTHDVWVSCHACPPKGQRVTMPIADLFGCGSSRHRASPANEGAAARVCCPAAARGLSSVATSPVLSLGAVIPKRSSSWRATDLVPRRSTSSLVASASSSPTGTK